MCWSNIKAACVQRLSRRPFISSPTATRVFEADFFFSLNPPTLFYAQLVTFALERAALGLQPCHGEIVFIYNSFAPGWYAEARPQLSPSCPFCVSESVLVWFFLFSHSPCELDLKQDITKISSCGRVWVCLCVCEARPHEATRLIKHQICFGLFSSCAAGKQWWIC